MCSQDNVVAIVAIVAIEDAIEQFDTYFGMRSPGLCEGDSVWIVAWSLFFAEEARVLISVSLGALTLTDL
jgi:hypothetical protein